MTTPNTSAVNELFPIEIFKKQLMANHANCKLSTVNSPLSNCSRLNIFKNISPCITNRTTNQPPSTTNHLNRLKYRSMEKHNGHTG
jgi:hypothetical protein